MDPDLGKRLREMMDSMPKRDPARIAEILSLITQVWKQHPDMRLGQLIVNLLDPKPNPVFMVEDDILRDRLKDFLATGVWPTQSEPAPDSS